MEYEKLEELVDKGVIESKDYYISVTMAVFPVLDYLRPKEIKQLLEWMWRTHDEMVCLPFPTKDCEGDYCGTVVNGGIDVRKGRVAIEYLYAIKEYLDGIGNRTGTAWTG